MPLPRERLKEPCSPGAIAGYLALADAQPTIVGGVRARAGLPGGGARPDRGDLRGRARRRRVVRPGAVIVPCAAPRAHGEGFGPVRTPGSGLGGPVRSPGPVLGLLAGQARAAGQSRARRVPPGLDGLAAFPGLDHRPAAWSPAARRRGTDRAGHFALPRPLITASGARAISVSVLERPSSPGPVRLPGAPCGDPAGCVRERHRRPGLGPAPRSGAGAGCWRHRGGVARPAAAGPHPASRCDAARSRRFRRAGPSPSCPGAGPRRAGTTTASEP